MMTLNQTEQCNKIICTIQNREINPVLFLNPLNQAICVAFGDIVALLHTAEPYVRLFLIIVLSALIFG